MDVNPGKIDVSVYSFYNVQFKATIIVALSTQKRQKMLLDLQQ